MIVVITVRPVSGETTTTTALIILATASTLGDSSVRTRSHALEQD